ncbi:MAG: hypothetical protein Q7K71_03840 [Candidatus Omnitrophota bacterium]|nr:hypothetical protein [Candidatus Omnitrophota bacterium]
MKMYKYPGRGTTIVFDQPLAARKLPPPKTLKNLITEAMKFHDYLAEDTQRTFFDASREFKVTRSWISQLMKIANALPTNFLKDMKSCTDQTTIKRFSGKTLMHIAKLKTPQERQTTINNLLSDSASI